MLATELLPYIITTFENGILANNRVKYCLSSDKNAAAYPQQ
jgi:hypothetical protein